MKNLLKIFILSLAILGLVGAVSAQLYEELEKVVASGGSADDKVGYAVSVSGDTLLSGAYGDDSEKGAAYIYNWNGSSWGQSQKLTALDGVGGDRFGWDVSISGNWALVAAFMDDSGKGAAYVYNWNGATWMQIQKLTASDGVGNDFFGVSVFILGDTLVVGAYGNGENGYNSGAAYVYNWDGSTWGQTQKLIASDGAATDNFGRSVSISGNNIVVGSYGDDVDKGSVYVFTRNESSWSQTQKLTATDGVSGDGFGIDVSLSGDRLVAGSYKDDSNKGSVYIYDWNGSMWSQTQKLTAVDGVSGDYFGRAVSLLDDRVLLGAYGDDSERGSVYVYDWNGSIWSQTQKLMALDGAGGDRFGWDVYLSKDWSVGGAYGDDDNGNSSGSVYFFGFPADNFCSADAFLSLTSPIADSIYWDLEGNNPYLANSDGTAVSAIIAPAETVKATTAELPAAGTAEPGMVYFDEQTGELHVADASGTLQDPATITSNAVADTAAVEASAVAGEVYFNTTTGEVFYCEVDGVLDNPADPSSSCLTQ